MTKKDDKKSSKSSGEESESFTDKIRNMLFDKNNNPKHNNFLALALLVGAGWYFTS